MESEENGEGSPETIRTVRTPTSFEAKHMAPGLDQEPSAPNEAFGPLSARAALHRPPKYIGPRSA